MSNRRGQVAMEHNGSGLKEVPHSRNFNVSTNACCGISFKPLLYEVKKCAVGDFKLNFLF